MPDLLSRLQGVDLTAPSPGPLAQQLASIDLRPPAQIENDARGASALSRRLTGDALRVGMPLTDGQPDFDPPASGNTNYVNTYTAGSLRVSLNDVSPTKLNSEALKLTADFAARRPNAASFMAPPPAPEDKAASVLQKQVSMRLLQAGVRSPEAVLSEPPAEAVDPNRPLLEANFSKFKASTTWISAIKHAPPRPAEKLQAIDAAWTDWSAANLVGSKDGLPNRSKVPPDLARNVLAKLIDAPDYRDAAENTLRMSVLDPAEKQAFEAMGGWDAVKYASSRLPFYTVRDRVSKLTGSPITNPGPISIDARQDSYAFNRHQFGNVESGPQDRSQIPLEYPLDAESLAPISSHTRNLLMAGQELGVQQAQAHVTLNTAFGGAVPAAISSYLGQPLGEEAYAKSSVFGGFTQRLGALTTGPLVLAGAEAFSRYAPVALNAALMGAPNAVLEGLTSVKRGIGRLAANDPDAITKGYEYLKQRAARSLALGGDDTEKSLARNADALFGAYPDADVEARLEVGSRFFSTASAVDGFLRRQANPDSAIGGSAGAAAANLFGLGTPETRLALGNVLEGMAGSFEALSLSATMAKPLYNWTQRGFAPKVLKDPLKAKAFTHFERDLGQAGSYSSAAPDLRAKMLQPVLKELDRLHSPEAAAHVVTRLTKYLDSVGVPITPESAAALKTTIERYSTIEKSVSGTQLSEPARSALRDLAEPIADLSDIDQQFVLRGDSAYIGPGGSARRLERITRFLERQAEASDAIAEPVATGLQPGQLTSAINGMIQENRRISSFAQRQLRLLDVTADLRRQTFYETEGLRATMNDHLDLAGSVAQHWNSFIDGETRLSQRIETQGVLADTPNPATRTKAFRALNRALIDHDTPALIELAKNDPEFSKLLKAAESPSREAAHRETPSPTKLFSAAGLRRLRATDLPSFKQLIADNAPSDVGVISYEKIIDNLSGQYLKTRAPEAFVSGVTSPAAIADLAQWWGRRELQNALRPLKSTVGPVDRPAADLSDKLLNRTAEAAKAKSFVTLSKPELDYLNTYRTARGLEPLKKGAPVHLDSLAKTADNFSKRLEESSTFLDEITKFRDGLLRADPEKGFRVPGDAAVLKEIQRRLDAPEQALVDKNYVALSTDPGVDTIKGKAAFQEALNRFSAQHARIEAGVQQISSMEMAFIGTQNPALLRPAIESHARTAQGVLNRAFARVAELDKIAARTLSEAERRDIIEDMRTGTPRSEIAAIMLQKQRRWMLDELLDSGAITSAQHFEYSKAAYYHGYYSPDTKIQADASITLRPNLLPRRFASLKVDSSDFMGFKIPDDGYYVTVREGGGLKHIVRNPETQALFATEQDAAAWLDKTTHIRDGSEVSINAPWTLTDKQISNLIFEPVVSHADLMQRAALHASKHRLTSFLRDTPFVATEDSLIARAASGDGTFSNQNTVFKDGSTTWTKIQSPKLPHLDGTFVSDKMLTHLRLYDESMPWIRSLWELPEENLRIFGNPLLDLRTKAFVGAGRGALAGLRSGSNAFTLAHVGLSFSSMLNNLFSNLMYSRYTGLNAFTNPLKFMKYNLDYFKARYRAVEADPYLDALYGHDLVRRAGVAKGLGDLITHNIEKHWKAVEPLHIRKTTMEAALEGAYASGDAALAGRVSLELERLNNEIIEKGPASFKGTFHTLLNHGKEGVLELGRASQGRGKLNTHVWNVYGEVGLDNSIKYANLKYLVEEKGFSMGDALVRIETFTQQLHRVPSFVRKSTNHIGGAMFTSYPYEQARILSEILKKEPLTLLMDGALFSGMNSAVLASQGINQKDFLEANALEHGLNRNVLTDAYLMSGRLLHPDGHGGVSAISLAPVYYDIFMPSSKASQQINGVGDELLSNSRSAPGEPPDQHKELTGFGMSSARGVKTATLGLLSKFALSDLSTELIRGLSTGRDSRGDPMNSMWDYTKFGLGLFTPPGLPGSTAYNRTRNVLADKEINPRTGRKTSVPELITQLTFKSRPLLDSPARFQAAMTDTLRMSGKLYSFQRDMKYDEMLSTLLARGARNGDGTLDPDEARPIIEQFNLEHPRGLPGPAGTTIENPFDEDSINARLKASASPAAISAFHRLPLPDQLAIYSLWRSVDTEAPATDARWNALVEDAITSKFQKGRSSAPAQVQEALKVMDEWTRAGSLPPDASANVHRWAGQAGQLLLRHLSR